MILILIGFGFEFDSIWLDFDLIWLDSASIWLDFGSIRVLGALAALGSPREARGSILRSMMHVMTFVTLFELLGTS